MKEIIMVKAKLQDYSLINNEWLDKEIERLTIFCKRPDCNSSEYLNGKIDMLKELKLQLIPSNKLQFFNTVELFIPKKD